MYQSVHALLCINVYHCVSLCDSDGSISLSVGLVCFETLL